MFHWRSSIVSETEQDESVRKFRSVQCRGILSYSSITWFLYVQVVLAALVSAAFAAPQVYGGGKQFSQSARSPEADAPILRYDNDVGFDGTYRWRYAVLKLPSPPPKRILTRISVSATRPEMASPLRNRGSWRTPATQKPRPSPRRELSHTPPRRECPSGWRTSLTRTDSSRSVTTSQLRRQFPRKSSSPSNWSGPSRSSSSSLNQIDMVSQPDTKIIPFL